MVLTKIRLGDYIISSTTNNNELKYGSELIEGVISEGKFSKPKGDVKNVNLKPYKIVNDGAFVYNPSRLNLGSIAYRTTGMCIVSHLYVVFYLNEMGKRHINPQYLYMYIVRKEFLREVTFRNFGSQRAEFNFEKLSDIELYLPSLEIQNKYVSVYNTMFENQKTYESGLDDLRLICFAMADKFKHTKKKLPVGLLLEEVDVRNTNLVCKDVQGVNITKQFMPTIASSSDVKNSKLVYKNQFVFSGMQTGRDKCIRIALHNNDTPIAVSPAYKVLKRKTDKIIEDYIQMWFSRPETDRRGWFMSDASIRANLDLPRFFEIEIPVPDIEEQESLVNIYKAYTIRRDINERLKAQIKDLCPILIKGSLQEGVA